MAYRVAIVDDSNVDAEYVQSILSVKYMRGYGAQPKVFSWNTGRGRACEPPTHKKTRRGEVCVSLKF